MKLRKCSSNEKHSEIVYTLKSVCPSCKKETSSAHYKFIKIRDAKEQ